MITIENTKKPIEDLVLRLEYGQNGVFVVDGTSGTYLCEFKPDGLHLIYGQDEIAKSIETELHLGGDEEDNMYLKIHYDTETEFEEEVVQ